MPNILEKANLRFLDFYKLLIYMVDRREEFATLGL